MSKCDPEDGRPWDLSEGVKMERARHVVRNTKHILLVLSVPCTLMDMRDIAADSLVYSDRLDVSKREKRES